MAHLGNFAYDPINYGAFDALHVVDLFLDAADDEDPVIRRLGAQALSNCAAGAPAVQHAGLHAYPYANLGPCAPPDPVFARALAAEEEEDKAVSRGLASDDLETVLAAAMTLYCLARAGQAEGAWSRAHQAIYTYTHIAY